MRDIGGYLPGIATGIPCSEHLRRGGEAAVAGAPRGATGPLAGSLNRRVFELKI